MLEIDGAAAQRLWRMLRAVLATFWPAPLVETIPCDQLDNLGCGKILWAGCGHAPEAILWLLRKAAAGGEVEILGLEKTQQAAERGHMLLRRVYMAYYGCAAEEAAALDLTQPVSIGLSHITIVHTDFFEYASAVAVGTLESFDTVFSAAGRDASDNHGMSLSILLMAIASLLATGRLLMYKSMWGEKGVRSPQPAEMEGDFVGFLQGSNEPRRIRAHIMDPMFLQHSTSSSRESLVTAGWRRVPVRNLADGTRIAIYWGSENLYYFGFVKRHTMNHDRDIAVLYDDAGVVQPEQLDPTEVVLVHCKIAEDGYPRICGWKDGGAGDRARAQATTRGRTLKDT